jgi:hypothetical protein
MDLIKDKVKLKLAKEEVRQELKSCIFWIYLGSMILFGVLFIFIKDSLFRIIALLGLIVLQLIYNIKQKNKEWDIFNWVYFIVFSIYFIIYASLQLGIFEITAIGLISLPFLLISGGLIISYINLKKSDSTTGKIITYFLFVLLIILLFSMLFLLTNTNEKNKIIDSEKNTINKGIEYIWFSAGNFYMCNFGEKPFGFSKTLSYFEMMISMIIHVIILGKIMKNGKK